MIRHSGNKWTAPPRFNVAVRIWEKKLKRKVFNNRIVVVILSVYSRAQDGPRNSFGIKRGHIFCFVFSPLNCGQPCGLSYSAGEAAARVHRAPATALQIATEFATIGSMFSPSQPIRPGVEGKLAALRRLDKSRAWNSLDDQLYCTICKTVISGRQIEVVGGTNGLRALHINCSTPGCLSTPADWLFPVKSDTVREIDILFRDNGVRTSTTGSKPCVCGCTARK